MTIQEFKIDFYSKCKSHFTNDEIQSYWLWFKENLNNDSSSTDNQYNQWIEELLGGKPIQYIFGYAFFHKYCFHVSADTLIPRPETEELCELILTNNSNKPITGIDIGTGSGCIPITLLAERSEWTFTAMDIDQNALAITEKNSSKYQVSHRITLLKQNFLENFNSPNNFDVIVSNPPYIHPNEISNLENRVSQFEPHIALFVTDHILEFYFALFHFFEQNSNPNAQLWMETHQDYCNKVVDLFNKKFKAKKIEDLSGNPRFVYVTK